MLLDVVRDRIRVKHYSYRTETSYLGWIRRFIRFHAGRHPREMSGPEVERFLTHLATERKVTASTQNQALSAILFLYREALEIDLPWLDGLVRAKRPVRVPVVLSRDEARRVLAQQEGTHWLAASLLYGAGLRRKAGCGCRRGNARCRSARRPRGVACGRGPVRLESSDHLDA